MEVHRVGELPVGAVAAAAEFYAKVLPEIVPPFSGEDLVVVFPPAPYDHRAWRLAAVQDLARAAAQARVNGIVGDEEAAIAETLDYLASAPGITGQLLAVGPV